MMNNISTMPLSTVPSGKQVQIVNIEAGWGLQRRLADMGLTPGLKVMVISSQKPGSVVLDVRGSRLALGRGISHKIIVRTTDY
ncbi:MAG: FeoA family protein [Chloroflexota bacterium]